MWFKRLIRGRINSSHRFYHAGSFIEYFRFVIVRIKSQNLLLNQDIIWYHIDPIGNRLKRKMIFFISWIYTVHCQGVCHLYTTYSCTYIYIVHLFIYYLFIFFLTSFSCYVNPQKCLRSLLIFTVNGLSVLNSSSIRKNCRHTKYFSSLSTLSSRCTIKSNPPKTLPLRALKAHNLDWKLIITTTFFQEDNIFRTSASLTNGSQLQDDDS